MNLKYVFKRSLLSGLIAFALLAPITGLILDGFTFESHLKQPLYLSFLLIGVSAFIQIIQSQATVRKAISWLNQSKSQDIQVGSANRHRKKLLLCTALIGLSIPFILNKYWLSVAILALIYVLLGLGLNIVVGLAGLLDLGYVAFYAVGAYTYALGAMTFDLSFWLALPLAALCSATFGALLGFPVLRMHGDYLAIVTLGFGEIIRLVLNNWGSLTGGPNGISAPFPTLFGLEFSRRASEGSQTLYEYFSIPYQNDYRYIFMYFIIFILVCLCIRFVTRLHIMPIGRAWEALREDEIAARSLGINHVTTKLSAFSLGAMIGGVGGVVFAGFQGFINPASFTFMESAIILAIVVLGGMGSTLGVILAAIILTLLPELLREVSEYRMFAFGALMVGMMIWRPRGLIRMKRPWFSKPKVVP